MMPQNMYCAGCVSTGTCTGLSGNRLYLSITLQGTQATVYNRKRYPQCVLF